MDILIILFLFVILALSIGVIVYQALGKNSKPLKQIQIEISCENITTPKRISTLPTFPFQIVPLQEGWGSVDMIFYGNDDYTSEIGSQLVILDGVSPAVVSPFQGTKSIGYIFRCTPITITTQPNQDVALNPNLPYWIYSSRPSTKVYFKDGSTQSFVIPITINPSKPGQLNIIRYTTT